MPGEDPGGLVHAKHAVLTAVDGRVGPVVGVEDEVVPGTGHHGELYEQVSLALPGICRPRDPAHLGEHPVGVGGRVVDAEGGGVVVVLPEAVLGPRANRPRTADAGGKGFGVVPGSLILN